MLALPKKVLTVQESDVFARLARVNLERAGCEVVASCVEDALDVARREQPDVVVIDACMDCCDSLADDLRSDPQTRNVVIKIVHYGDSRSVC